MKAVILAAGNGLRLSRRGGPPKPLVSVAGLPLIMRVILSAREAGIRDFVVVLNPHGEAIRREVLRRIPADVRASFVLNPEWERGNASSLYAAAPAIGQESFVLLMADHVFEPGTLKALLRAQPDQGSMVLAIDRRTAEVFDIQDAMKVALHGDRISRLGKELAVYEAIDTGMFFLSPDVFDVARSILEQGRGGLGDVFNEIAARGGLRGFDIGSAFWQDVDTSEARRVAHRWYWRGVVKPSDGLVSRHFNRKISGWVSRLALWLGVTADQMTFVTLGIGMIAALEAARGDSLSLGWGGVLFMLASIVDGCDGEIATLTYSKSKRGEWFDTLADNLTYIMFIGGVGWGVVAGGGSAPSSPYLVGLVGLALWGVIASLGVMYYYLIRYTGSGSLVTVYKEVGQELQDDPPHGIVRFLGRVRFVVKRDFFALLFMVLCLAGQPVWILLATAVAANLIWPVVLFTGYKFGLARAVAKE